MTAVPTCTMTGYIDGILATVRAHAWPWPITDVGFRQPELIVMQDLGAIRTPALLLDMPQRSSDTSMPRFPGVSPRRCICHLYCLLSFQTERTALEMLELTESVWQLLEQRDLGPAAPAGNRWGLGAAVEYPELIDDDEPGLILHGIAVRRVSWEQVIHLQELPRPS